MCCDLNCSIGVCLMFPERRGTFHTIHPGVDHSEKMPFVCLSALAQACPDLQGLRFNANFEDPSAAEGLRCKCVKEQRVSEILLGGSALV